MVSRNNKNDLMYTNFGKNATISQSFLVGEDDITLMNNLSSWKESPPEKEKYIYIKNRTGILALMCPKCFHVEFYQVSSSTNISVQSLQKTEAEELNISAYPETHYLINKCKECETEEVLMIEVDPNLASAISILNKKGFYTVACCESHNEYALGNILFKTKAILPYLRSLPLAWFVDVEFLRLYDKINIQNNYSEKKESMYEILKWANSLPDSASKYTDYFLK